MEYLSSAFTLRHVQEGWKRAGLYPFDPASIMRRCTTWAELTAFQGRAILNAIPQLTETARQRGEITDDDMQDAVGTSINFNEWLDQKMDRKPGSRMALSEQVLNRRRVIWLNH